MYTPRLLKITAANILIFIIKKQTVIKHSKTNIILIDIVKFNLVVLGILLHYDSWQEVFFVLAIYLLIMLLNIVLCRLNALMDAEREDVHKGYLPLNFVCIIKNEVLINVYKRIGLPL